LDRVDQNLDKILPAVSPILGHYQMKFLDFRGLFKFFLISGEGA